MKLGKRARRDQEITDLRRQVDELRELSAGAQEALASQIARLRADVDHLLTGLNRAQGAIDQLEDDLRNVAGRLDAAPATTEPVTGPSGPQADGRPATEPDPAGERDAPANPQLSDKQAALVAAVNELGEASTGDIARHVGRADQGDAVSMALQKLRRMGLVGHNGRRAKGARWLALDTRANRLEDALATPAATFDGERHHDEPAPATDQAVEITQLDERIIRLVSEHGPVTAVWVADQVVKNRRETAARMRDLARAGYLVDLEGAFAAPDLAEAA